MTTVMPNIALLQGYRDCAAVTREHGTTYYWGARLLPASQRRHVHALYTLARLADDIVDEAGPEGAAGAEQRLDAFEGRFWSAVQGRELAPLDERGGEHPSPSTLAAIATTVRECRIPDEKFTRFFRAMRSDLTRRTYDTWADLLDYMDGSAAVIGEMMLPVLQPATSATTPARALGLAFQLTNFLRDVGEDLGRGRVYLPQEDLARFGVDPQARVVDDGWRAMMAFQIERNRRLYREADLGIPLLPSASQRCVATARVLYARILEHIEANDYDVFTRRARVPTTAKAGMAARMLTSKDPVRQVSSDRAGRRSSALSWPDDDEVVLVDDAGTAIGTGRKSEVHHDDTPLHLAFSCYVFDSQDRLLVTRRARSKASFPGIVTNSACGHPRPGESLVDTVHRRLASELGAQVKHVRLVLPEYRYRAAMDGLVENEVCPVLVARAVGDEPTPDPSEVEEYWWTPWPEFLAGVRDGSTPVSPWCADQVEQLAALGAAPECWPHADPARLPAAATLGDETS